MTGGSRGIGRAICLALAEAGANVAVHYHVQEAAALAVVNEVAAKGVQAVALQANVGDPAQAEALVHAAKRALGPIDILVHNAGIAQSKLLIDTTVSEWQAMLAVHLDAAFYCCRAVLPDMIGRGWGRIILMTSIWGLVGAAAEVPYSAAKAGLIGLTKALAKEVGRAGVTVNAVAPGIIDTDMISDYTDAERAEMVAATPVGRLGVPADVAAAVRYLVTEPGFVTGQVISPNGGFVT